MLTPEQFLALVEQHLEETATKASPFGKEVLGDPSFVFELRAGRKPNLKIVNQVIDAINRRNAARTVAA